MSVKSKKSEISELPLEKKIKELLEQVNKKDSLQKNFLKDY